MLARITHEFAPYLPWLTAIAVKASLLLLIALVTGQLLRRASAALRHVVYVASIVGILLLPLAGLLLPSFRVPILPPHAAPPASIAEMTPTDIETTPKAIVPDSQTSKSEPLTLRTKSGAETSTAQGGVAPRNDVSQSPQSALPVSRQTAEWRGILILGWIAGCVVCLLRMFVTHLKLSRLVKEALAVDSIPLSSRLRWLCRDLGIKQEVTLLASHELDVPIAVGVLSAKIVLSPQSGEWSETRRNAVLCHELAHIKRGDAFTQWLASLAAAVYWFNPLAWMVARAMRAERERACDDYVLAYGTAASDYAHELVEIVSTLVRPQPAAALAMARRSQLEGRVMALLNARVTHGVPRRITSLGFVSMVLAVALPLAAARLEERPGHEAWGIPSTAASSIYTSPAPAITETFPSPQPAPRPPENMNPGIGIPIYPNAVAGDHTDGRGTVSLVEGAHLHSLAAAAYFSQDDPTKVLAFYRDRLRTYGQVIECAGGTNNKVDVQVNRDALANPTACQRENFAENGTELKVSKSGDERIVVVQPHGSGSEIALVRYPAEVDAAESISDEKGESPSHNSEAPFDCLEGSQSNQSSINSHSDGAYRVWTATWSGNGCSIEARSTGEVRFSPDATSIESISSGGYFELSERAGGNLRHVRIAPSSTGQLTYDYSVDGSKHDFDTEARAWLSKLLLQLERATGFSASTRVPALLKQGGPEAVLNEITQLQSDYVRQVYFTKLFENATLPAPLLVKALNQAREEIETDYSLAQVLLTIAQRYDLNNEAQRVAFLNGANKLGTDYEHARVLIELLKRPNLSPQIVRGTLESAKHIGTDYEKSRILTTLAGLSTFDQGEVSSYLDLASSIGTDYEHSRSLLALMDHQKLTPEATSQVLRSATTIGTDYEKSRILLALSKSHNFDEKQIATYLTLVDSVGTDYERSRDLIALMQQHKLANDSVLRLLNETQKLGTDYEKARVLTEAAKQYQIEGALRDAYIKAADSIGTEYDRNRTLAAISKRDMT